MAADQRPTPARHLAEDEMQRLLALDIPAHFATLDRAGFPRITPISFLWKAAEHQGKAELTRDLLCASPQG
jgi:hypothetical protein